VLSCATFYARRYVRTVSLFAGDVRYLGKNSVILDDILKKKQRAFGRLATQMA